MYGPRQRQELVGRIFELSPGDTATLFVTLWTYFLRAGLFWAERELQQQYGSRAMLPAYRGGKSPSPPEILGKLIHLPGEFDLLCLRWLKGLDDVLQQKSGTFDGMIEGFDRLRYWIRRRNDFLALQYMKNGCGVTLAERQGGSLWRYCRAFVVLPTEEADRQVDCRSHDQWGDPLLHARLERARREFAAVCWPLSNALVLASTGGMRLTVSASSDPAMRETLQAAVDAARAVRATILLFPELTLALDDLRLLQGILEEQDPAEGYPLLTVAGIVHQTESNGNDINEAVLLGPDGTVLHRQRKLYPYEQKDGAMERLEAGQTLTILESAVGNFTVLICLDFFNENIARLLRQSHANLFLVPSMSETTGAHDTAAVVYRAQNGAFTALCNRNFAGSPSAAQHTFVAAPGTREGRVVFDNLRENTSHLVYALEYPDSR